ncbi:MAG: SEC-C domain-containing protein [Nitrospiraceae bacterium]|nr:SEC-C domain-containing protein [Nitrospiraceae bacterium]
MTDRISTEALSRIFKVQVSKEEPIRKISRKQELVYNQGDGSGTKQPLQKGRKVGRNDSCPCGSGKKFKKCCGINA